MLVRSRLSAASAIAIMLFCAALAFALYPGWLFYDAIVQWEVAKRLVDHGFPLRLSSLSITSQWPIFVTLLKVPFLALTGEVGFYIFCQSLAMFAAVRFLTQTAAGGLLGRRATEACWWLAVLTPFVWGYAVFHSSDTIAAIAAGAMIGAAAAPRLTMGLLAAFSVSAAVLMLSRYNAFPAALFLVGAFAFAHWGDLRSMRRAALGWGLGAAVAIGGTLAYQRTALFTDTATNGMLLRIWDVGQRVDDAILKAGLNGIAKKPIDGPLPTPCFDVGAWCPDVRQRFGPEIDHGFVRKLFFRAMRRYPAAFAETSARFAYYQLGIPKPVVEDELGGNKGSPTFDKLVQTLDSRRVLARDLVYGSEQFLWGAPSRPLVMTALSLLGTLFVLRSLRLAWICAGFYGLWLLPFIVVSPTFSFRYAFPATFTAYVVICASAFVLGSRIWARARGAPLGERGASLGPAERKRHAGGGRNSTSCCAESATTASGV
jgi:hypothetical protein